MDQVMTSGDSSECTRWSSGVQTIYGRAGRSCGCKRLGKSSRRHGCPKELFWVRKLGKEVEMGIEIRFKQRWQRGIGLVEKAEKSTKNPRPGKEKVENLK